MSYESLNPFIFGYRLASSGRIGELSAREIEDLYPGINIAQFTQGMVDGLKNDPWRFDRIMQVCPSCCAKSGSALQFCSRPGCGKRLY